MKALRRVGLPVPKPLDCSRHCVVMELIKGTLFENVRLRDRHINEFKSNAESSSSEEELSPCGATALANAQRLAYCLHDGGPRSASFGERAAS